MFSSPFYFLLIYTAKEKDDENFNWLVLFLVKKLQEEGIPWSVPMHICNSFRGVFQSKVIRVSAFKNSIFNRSLNRSKKKMQYKAAIPVIRLYFRFFTIKKKKSVENQEGEMIV